MKKLVIIPSFNEEKNIINVLEELRDVAPDYDYLVVNDCSVDNTLKILKEYSVRYISFPVNLGIGGAVQAGYKYAVENDYEVAIQMDGDGQHVPEYLDALTKPICSGDADVCIGSRFMSGDGTFKSTRFRRIGISFLSTLIKVCTGLRIKDVTSGFRAVNRPMMALYAQDYPQDYPEPEAIVMAARRGAKITEVPVNMRERKYGKSTINPVQSVYYMVKVSLAILVEKSRRTN